MTHNYFTATPTFRGKHVFAFISPQGAGPISCPLLDGCVLTGGVDVKSDTQIVKMKCPSNTNRNEFSVVSQFDYRRSLEPETSLSARLPADMRSLFLKLTQSGHPFDMVWASGVSSDPNDLTQFDRLEIFEGVFSSLYTHDAVGTYDMGEVGEDVLETVDLTVTKYFDFARPEIAGVMSLSGGSFTDVAYCPASCADVGDSRINNIDGAAFPVATSIFPGTPNRLNVYYSTDSGETLTFSAVDSGDFTTASVMCFNGHVVIGHNGTSSDYYYTDQDGLLSGSSSFTAVGSGGGLSAGATDGTTLYMMGNGVYSLTRNQLSIGAVPVPGTQGTKINAMSHYRGKFIAVGDGGNIEIIKNGYSTQASTPTGSDLVTIDIVRDGYWWVGDVDGNVYWTPNAGDQWVSVDNLGANPGVIFASKYVGYLSTDDGLYLTVDGGCTWSSLYDSGSFCGIDICDNGNRFVACRDGDLLIGMDKLSQKLFDPLALADRCALAGVTTSFNYEFVAGANPNELTIELRDASFTGSTTVTGYTYEFISGPIVGSYPAVSGDLDITTTIPGSSDDNYLIRLDISIVECGVASSVSETLSIPCSIIVCGNEAIVCGTDVLIGNCNCT